MSDDLVSDLRQQATNRAERMGGGYEATVEWRAAAEIERLKDHKERYFAGWNEEVRLRQDLQIAKNAAESELSTLRAELDASNANHRQMATTMADLARKHDTLRARVREVVGPFGNLVQRYDDTVSDGWIPWTEFIADHEWPTESDCRAARQLNEDLK